MSDLPRVRWLAGILGVVCVVVDLTGDASIFDVLENVAVVALTFVTGIMAALKMLIEALQPQVKGETKVYEGDDEESVHTWMRDVKRQDYWRRVL